MTLVEFLLLLVIAGICGVTGQAIAGSSRGGFLAAIGIGFVGALLGSWMARALRLPEIFLVNLGGTSFPVLWSILGSAAFVALLALLTRGSRLGRRSAA